MVSDDDSGFDRIAARFSIPLYRHAPPAADAELRTAVIALAKERNVGYSARMHAGVVDGRIADKVVELARRLAGDGGVRDGYCAPSSSLALQGR